MRLLLGSMFKHESAAAFAIFRFWQSVLSAVAYFYSNHLELPYQLLILAISCISGTITFFIIDLHNRRAQHGADYLLNNETSAETDDSSGIMATSPQDDIDC